MNRRGHLRVVPRPLARCGVDPRPYPPIKDGVSLRPAPTSGRWLLEQTIQGRTTTLYLTREDLLNVFQDAGSALASGS